MNLTKAKFSLAVLLLTFTHRGIASAQTALVAPDHFLPEITVTGEAEASETVQGMFLPPVQGTKINSGKKTSVLDFDDLPKINNNNYRQALAKTPGLLLSEESSPLVSIGYRGLNPHRAQFTQMLKDGIPIHADQFGYPEAYYTPPLDTVDRLEFLRGGASLMYGPQPGGALNYVTHQPRRDKEFSLRSQHVFGNDSLYSTFNSVDGTVGRLGYYAFFNHRQTDGFRTANSDVDLFAGSTKLVLDAATDSRWILNFDGYEEEHGEPGGLSVAAFNAGSQAASRLNDRFQLKRYAGSLAWEKDLGENTALTVTGWGGYYSRLSRRQRGGGFGTLPTGASASSNAIELQEFFSQGVEGRLRHDWTQGENLHTLAAGFQLYHTDSPRTDKRGATPSAHDGALRNRNNRDILYAPFFVENRFEFGPLSLTPGVRLENVWQGVKEKVNVDKTTAGTPLGDKRQRDFVPLLGLGVEYALPRKITAYGNWSQAYRPKMFSEAVPTGGTTFINDDLDEGQSWQGEIGLRGQPIPGVVWDASLFRMEFSDQIGSVPVPGGTSLENVGDTVHQGLEAALELELFGLADAWRGEDNQQREHTFSLYGNLMWLDAEIKKSPTAALVGNTPQYAPDYILRSGIVYRWKTRVKVAFTGTWLDEHFADDANSVNFRVPSYTVWDLTAECKVYREHVSLIGGINNLFDESYYSRVRSDGIDPGAGRNFYVGASFAF